MRPTTDVEGDVSGQLTPATGGGRATPSLGDEAPSMRFSGRARGRTPGLTRERNGLLRRLPTSTISRRSLSLLLVYALLIGAIVFRLTKVQIVDAEAYASQGAEQRERTITLAARRGRLYDRLGNVLALSVDAATVYGDPAAFLPDPELAVDQQPPTPRSVAEQLAPILDADVDDLTAKLTGDNRFVYLGRQLDWEVGEQVRDAGLHGVGILTEPTREYPAGSLAAQVLGFTDIDGDGRTGLERTYDEVLQGQPGQLEIERAGAGGFSIASGLREIQPATQGTDLVLTLDREIQDVAQAAADAAVEQYDAASASVVVTDPRTGDVLAMATSPTYDPHDPGGSDPGAWRNRAVTDIFEPGSVMKALTGAAALEEGIVEPGSILRVEDTIDYGGSRFSDSHSHDVELLTFEEVMEQSSNVGTIMVADRLGEERLAGWLSAFGLGRQTGVGFPSEASGILPDTEYWSGTSLPTIAIGYGVAATLLQLATAYGTIANDGIAVEPRLVKGTVGDDGREVPAATGATRRVIASDTAAQLRTMLSRVVNGESGTGKRAAVEGYEVAGKTGTARKAREDGRGYGSKYVASFVGFAPASDPQLVVAVTVDEPYPIYGGVVAAPAFREVMEFALPHRRVPPSRTAPEPVDPARTDLPEEGIGVIPGVLPDGVGDDG